MRRRALRHSAFPRTHRAHNLAVLCLAFSLQEALVERPGNLDGQGFRPEKIWTGIALDEAPQEILRKILDEFRAEKLDSLDSIPESAREEDEDAKIEDFRELQKALNSDVGVWLQNAPSIVNELGPALEEYSELCEREKTFTEIADGTSQPVPKDHMTEVQALNEKFAEEREQLMDEILDFAMTRESYFEPVNPGSELHEYGAHEYKVEELNREINPKYHLKNLINTTEQMWKILFRLDRIRDPMYTLDFNDPVVEREFPLYRKVAIPENKTRDKPGEKKHTKHRLTKIERTRIELPLSSTVPNESWYIRFMRAKKRSRTAYSRAMKDAQKGRNGAG